MACSMGRCCCKLRYHTRKFFAKKALLMFCTGNENKLIFHFVFVLYNDFLVWSREIFFNCLHRKIHISGSTMVHRCYQTKIERKFSSPSNRVLKNISSQNSSWFWGEWRVRVKDNPGKETGLVTLIQVPTIKLNLLRTQQELKQILSFSIWKIRFQLVPWCKKLSTKTLKQLNKRLVIFSETAW